MPTSVNGVNFFNPTDEDDEHVQQSSTDQAAVIDPLDSLKNCSLSKLNRLVDFFRSH
ncbi:unnamed protein product [Haemonchus placei]|uniref:Uncharacterized protein n=1 Tax=Haemonchus placei TaxID=6290 RepID=A0A0N4WNU2_HAEPC|nr:unnamed protein product [Haemonchus placei]